MSILFLSLAEKSTGELTYLVSSLNTTDALCRLGREVVLCVSEKLTHVAQGFPGIVHSHKHSRSSLKKIFEFVQDQINAFKVVVCIDLNCFILERNLYDRSLSAFKGILEKQAADGKRIALIDYFGCFHKQKDTYQTHRTAVLSKIQNLTKGLGRAGSRFDFYAHSFLPTRMMSQIHLVGPDMDVLRPVPLNFPKTENTRQSGIDYYRNSFAHDYGINASKSPQKILFAFSKFFENTIDHRTLQKLFVYTAQKFNRRFRPDEIVVIDPFGCTADLQAIDGAVVTAVSWMDKRALCETIERAYFVALLVPYGTLGTIAVLNGVPFVTIHNSISSSESPHIEKLVGEFMLPPFNALGVLEDHAFFEGLCERNPYFKAVVFNDLADPLAFDLTYNNIISGSARTQIEEYRRRLASLELSSLSGIVTEYLQAAQ